MTTSFCATTVVTPFFVTVFMMGKREQERDRERHGLWSLGVSEEETKKSGARASESHFMGFSISAPKKAANETDRVSR